MSTKPLAIVALSDDGILQADVAGHPISHYLVERLRRVGEIDIEFAVRLDASPAAWGAGHRIFTGDFSPFSGPVLIVDGRAWLAPGLLENLIESVRERDAFIRVVEPPRDGDRAAVQAATLVAAFPARIAAGQIASALSDVDCILAWDWANDAVRVEASALAPAGPSRLLSSLVELTAVEQQVLRERAMNALRAGVRLRDPHSIQIRGNLTCGAGVEIDINVLIEGDVALEEGVRIGAHSIVRQARIGKHTRIEPFSLVEASSVGEHSVVGPYGRVRPGTTVGDRVQIGNYVEIKNSRIGAGSRINHHSFIGDADLAEGVTIGAGTITCNHDGAHNVQTVIERGAYIGSGCNLVAPVRIGEDATVGAGSTITRDVPAAKLTLARSQQVTVENWRGPRGHRTPRT